MPRFYHLIYKSSDTVQISAADLASIIARSHTYMANAEISGLLVYRPDGHFLHVLEGPEESLQQLVEQNTLGVLQPTGCSVISGGPWARRSFSYWFCSTNLDCGPACQVAEATCVSLQHLPTLLPQLAANRPALVHLLLEFVESFVELNPDGVSTTPRSEDSLSTSLSTS
ncbi:BLUF domain-containing protein [Hymenobacter rigui]|uniref:BLUF domain-containing protein n=1 Tax=Hymenobacter rigui TaxID=334424 RepID=A0A3R9PPQ5_9BACT|nr:BLUF domain-containing protein [Hymenobacter rigui]RSK43127.1 BLUF domain-containing protein [Hymenobacter rigui]